MILGIIWEDKGKKKKGRWGKGRGYILLSLELGHFSKGITLVFKTMRIQYIMSYLKSKSKSHGPKKCCNKMIPNL
jgi:hypothetical protein